MPQSQAELLLSLMKNAKYVDLSVTTGANLPSSP